MIKKRILITGSTGYIGCYLTKLVAAIHPTAQVFALSLKNPGETAKEFPEIAKFSNVKFVEGNCLRPDSLPNEMNSDSLIHTVGAITDLFNYRKFLEQSPC